MDPHINYYIDYRLIGSRIRLYRNRLNLTQKQLTEKLGVSTPFISNIERGETKIGLKTLINIANIFNVSVDDLLCDNIRNNPYVNIYELNEVFKDCSPVELNILTKMIISVKDILRENEFSD